MEPAFKLEIEGTVVDARRHRRVRVPAPFACALSRRGLARWFSQDRDGLGVVFDVSIGGAKVMTETPIKPGDRMALRLNLPKQASPATVDMAAVRWANGQTFGVEFLSVSRATEVRLRKYLALNSQPATS